eukprot:jgi/Tetstr1/463069/TSEL_008004.t1
MAPPQALASRRACSTPPTRPPTAVLVAALVLLLAACVPPAAAVASQAEALRHLERNMPRYEAELLELVAIPSVSSLPERQPDVRRAAEWLVARLTAAGFQ